MSISREQISRFIYLMSDPAQTYEHVVIKPARQGIEGVGYFNDLPSMVESVMTQHGKQMGQYMGLNPVSIGARPFAPSSERTKRTDVMKRCRLLIDFDSATKPKDESSTEEEHQACIALAHRVRADLQVAGFPMPILGDSGNGASLIYAVDEPTDSLIVKQFLNALAKKYDNDMVKVDRSVCDAPRVTRLLGTLNCKGTSTPERPHRYSRIIDSPDAIEVVSHGLLEDFVGLPAIPKDDPFGIDSTVVDPFDIESFLKQYKVTFSPREGEGELHGALGKWFDLTLCPFKPETNSTGHTGIFQDQDGSLYFHCFHDSCQNKGITEFLERIARGYVARATAEVNKSSRVITDPSRLADLFLRRFEHPEHARILLWGDTVFVWDEVWTERSERHIKRLLAAHCENIFHSHWAQLRAKGVATKMPQVSADLVGNVFLVLTSKMRSYEHLKAGQWLVGSGPDATQLVVAGNGILDLAKFMDKQSSYLMPHTPRFFSMNKLPYDFDANPPEPRRFLQFLGEVFADPAEHDLVQEIFGLAITGDQRYQVFVVFQGTTGGGKRVLTNQLIGVVGEHNACSVDFDKLGSRFGLDEAIDKQLIVCPEAQMPERENGSTDMVKKMTGQDPVRTERKFAHGRTISKWGLIVIVSNHDVSPDDPSGAFYRRMIALRFVNSFQKERDIDLSDKLAAELPGTLLWAIQGWDRLRKARRFTMPESSETLKQRFQEAGSPILAFTNERCEVGADLWVEKDELLAAFNEYLEEMGAPTVTKKALHSLLGSAHPHVTNYRRDENGTRIQCYKGLSLTKPQHDAPGAEWSDEVFTAHGSLQEILSRANGWFESLADEDDDDEPPVSV